jgi:uncharacterized membrane protein
MSVTSSFKSFLTVVGEGFKKGLNAFIHYAPIVIADAQKVEQAAAPILSLAFPGVAAPILASTVTILNAALAIEQKFVASGAPAGSGPQKLAEVLSIVGPQAQQTLSSLGLPNDQATVEKWINAVVGFLNGLPVAQNPVVTNATATVTVS